MTEMFPIPLNRKRLNINDLEFSQFRRFQVRLATEMRSPQALIVYAYCNKKPDNFLKKLKKRISHIFRVNHYTLDFLL